MINQRLMLKKYLLLIPDLISLSSFAGTRTEVEYGVIQDSHITSATTQSRPLRTAATGAAGAAVGNQFRGGSGKSIMTATGAVAGAEASRRRQAARQSTQQIELLVKTDAGRLLDIVQDYDGALAFTKGDKVRILTHGADTHVDKSVQ